MNEVEERKDVKRDKRMKKKKGKRKIDVEREKDKNIEIEEEKVMKDVEGGKEERIEGDIGIEGYVFGVEEKMKEKEMLKKKLGKLDKSKERIEMELIGKEKEMKEKKGKIRIKSVEVVMIYGLMILCK